MLGKRSRRETSPRPILIKARKFAETTTRIAAYQPKIWLLSKAHERPRFESIVHVEFLTLQF